MNNGLVSTIEYGQLGNVKLSSLMSVGEKSWDVELLNDLICPRDVNLIKCIPIPMVESEDSW